MTDMNAAILEEIGEQDLFMAAAGDDRPPAPVSMISFCGPTMPVVSMLTVVTCGTCE
ncbi:hypothetical protein ACIBFB_13180 [Nocardiopsis sp. NPDC050513]|uniref:hypothetical protein n=1 Tax=Nocardiopsis sp. NPDC050513 TaxID=3364338 RepID=UPI0037A81E97